MQGTFKLTKGSVTILALIAMVFGYFIIDSLKYDSRIIKDSIDGHVISILSEHSRLKIYYSEKENTKQFNFKIDEDINWGHDNYIYNHTFNIKDELSVGDSLFKPANSNLLQVYKRNKAGKYEYYKKFKGD